MLVLRRKLDESVMILDEIEVMVLEIQGDAVRLGISAPKDVPVHRKEIWEAIKRLNDEGEQGNVDLPGGAE